MSEKRYQVFISSTFEDLQEERRAVSDTLLSVDCIPVGMEEFPATDEAQFDFIKKIIDESDYYLLIIGGRYGTVDDEGISFTEKEYSYAVSKNILSRHFKNKAGLKFFSLAKKSFNTIKIQMIALNLFDSDGFWQLTEKGKKTLILNAAIRQRKSS